jgi:hypothetical protein
MPYRPLREPSEDRSPTDDHAWRQGFLQEQRRPGTAKA